MDSLRPNEPYMMAHGRSSGWFRSADAREAFCRLHDTALAATDARDGTWGQVLLAS